MLEIIISFERAQQKIDIIQQYFHDVLPKIRSSFFIILSANRLVSLSEREKQLLQKMIDDGIVLRYRCKARADR